MIIGISIPSLIAVLGGVLTYGYINDVKSRQGFVQIADSLNEQVLEVRRNEKNFLHYKNDDSLNGLNNATYALTTSVSNISPETSKELGSREFFAVKELVDKYLGLANELDNSFRDGIKIEKKVRQEGARLEKYVATRKHAKELSTDFILRLRLLEKNYMFYRDKESYLELNKGLLQTKNITPLCYECIPYIDSVRELFTKYNKSASLIVSLQTAGDNMEKTTAEIAGRERQKINSFITDTQKFLLAALVLLFILGPLFVYKTASYIVTPIKRLAEITKKISKGDITLRAPLKEQDETYSLAVSFNTMLDNLHQTRKSLEESLGLLNEKQAQLVESEKRASMGFLVAGVAHELNNPLNNISLRAEIVQEEIRKFSDGKLDGYVHDIVTQSQRAHKIINNLLDFARARKSEGMEKQDIVSIVNDSFKLVENQLKINNIKLIKDITDRPFYVNGNRSKIEQILVSIINNAIQAMESGGTLTVGAGPDIDDSNLLISISDTGKGIPEADIKNIFEPFFTTKPPGEGTGLGLAVSHTLVTEHQGEIEVESKEGEGTAFTIKFPLFKEAS
jgi:signal transduction histidine kinase